MTRCLALPIAIAALVAAAIPAVGAGRAEAAPPTPDCGTADTPCGLELPVPLEVTGEVRDAVSARPVAGALVWPSDEPDRAVAADSRGRFVLRFAPGSRPQWFSAAADGYAPAKVWQRPDDAPQPLLVALRPAMRIAGRAVDADGAPLAGVRLRLLRAAGGFGVQPPAPSEEVETASGGDGRFRFPAVAAEGGRWLRAELAGYAPEAVLLRPETAGELEVVLRSGGGIAGRLIDRAGAPVPGGRVRIADRRSHDPFAPDGGLHLGAESTAGADGGFAIGHLAAGRYTLTVDHPGHDTRLLPPVEVAEGRTVDLGEIELAPGGSLAGLVLDPGGRPVDGAWASVVVESDSGGLHRAPGRTAEDGRFELTGLPLGEPLRLSVWTSGHPNEEIAGIVLPLDEPLVVELRAGSQVFGRVVGPRGEPVDGAHVQAYVDVAVPGGTQHGGSGNGTTAADGGFRIGGLVAGSLRLVAQAEGHPDAQVAGMDIGDDGEVGPIEIRLEAGAGLSGRVLAPDGSPAPGASVTVHSGRAPAELGIDRPSDLPRPAGPTRAFSTRAVTDVRGEFTLEGTVLGPATVVAEHDLLGDGAAELLVRPGANEVTVILDPRGRIHGRVVDGDGFAVAGAQVDLGEAGKIGWGRSTQTDAEGRFVFHRMDPGDYRLVAGAPGLRLDGPPVSVTLGDGGLPPLELVLTPGEEIAGTLIGLPEAGDPAKYRVIAYLGRASGLGMAQQFGTPGPDGRFRLTGLEPGLWTVNAYGPNGRNARAEVEVTAGGGPYRVDLEIGGGLTLAGTVTAAGEPLPGASVHLTRADGPHRASARTGSDGSFRIEGLEAGVYEVVVGHGMAHLGRRELDLAGDDEIHLDVAAASLAGSVLDAEGGPVGEAQVHARSARGDGSEGLVMTLTDPAGRFAFAFLPPGEYEVIANAHAGPSARATVSLEAGDRREVELRLDRGSELVLIPHLAGGGHPLRVTVSVLRAGGPVYQNVAPVAADGSAVFFDVPDGAWTLIAHGDETAMVEAAAEVPGAPVTVVLPPATVLEIEVPALAEVESVPFTIVGADGRPPAVVATRSHLRLARGRGAVVWLPPGAWTVHAAGPDGRRYEGTAVTVPGPPARLVLD